MKLHYAIALIALCQINFFYSVYNTNSVYNGGWSRPMRCVGSRFNRQKYFYDTTGPEGTITAGHGRRLKERVRSCYRVGRWYEKQPARIQQRR